MFYVDFSRRRFFAEVASASKPGAALLLAEPKGHVKESEFDAELHAVVEERRGILAQAHDLDLRVRNIATGSKF